MVAIVDLWFEGVKLTLEDLHDSLPAHLDARGPGLVLAGGVFGTITFGTASGVVAQALAVALQTVAFATLAALALCDSWFVSFDLGKELLLAQGLRHDVVQLVFQLSLVDL